jgi:hypothetical protein
MIKYKKINEHAKKLKRFQKIFTCEIKCTILTKIVIGTSLGFTTLDPLGNNVSITLRKRLHTQREKYISH